MEKKYSNSPEPQDKDYNSLDNFIDDRDWFVPRTKETKRVTPRQAKSFAPLKTQLTPNVKRVEPQPQTQTPAPERNELLDKTTINAFKARMTNLINLYLKESAGDKGGIKLTATNVLGKFYQSLYFNLTNVPISSKVTWLKHPQMRLTTRNVVEYPPGAKIPIINSKVHMDITDDKTVQIVKYQDITLKLTLDQLKQIVAYCVDDIIYELQNTIKG